MTEHLVTDKQAEKWSKPQWWLEPHVVKYLLATRAAFVEFLNEHTPGGCNHWPGDQASPPAKGGSREWCYDCTEWCYHHAPCFGCDARATLAELHGEKPSGA